MSETKPPEPHTSWLRWAVCNLSSADVYVGGKSISCGEAAKHCFDEYDKLRAQAAAYQEAMARLNDIEGLHDGECPWHWWGGFDPDKGVNLEGEWYKPGEEPVCECPVGKAERFVEAEIAAGRFAP